MRDRQLGQNHRVEQLKHAKIRADAESQRQQRS
jgi:hypothetical protein